MGAGLLGWFGLWGQLDYRITKTGLESDLDNRVNFKNRTIFGLKKKTLKNSIRNVLVPVNVLKIISNLDAALIKLTFTVEALPVSFLWIIVGIILSKPEEPEEP